MAGSKFSLWNLLTRLIRGDTPQRKRAAKSKEKRRAAMKFNGQRMPTVKFDTKWVTRTVLAALERDVRNLPEVTEANFEAFYVLAKRGVATGGDLHFFSTGISGLNIPGMTGQRAAQIATILWRRAHGRMDRERAADLGIARARWSYANAPCMADPHNPTPEDRRRDATHKAANGKVYVIAKGLRVDGNYTWPGDEFGCKCSSRSIIPGFED
jgi:hypothetical protein